jgi:hypothetical protein
MQVNDEFESLKQVHETWETKRVTSRELSHHNQFRFLTIIKDSNIQGSITSGQVSSFHLWTRLKTVLQ